MLADAAHALVQWVNLVVGACVDRHCGRVNRGHWVHGGLWVHSAAWVWCRQRVVVRCRCLGASAARCGVVGVKIQHFALGARFLAACLRADSAASLADTVHARTDRPLLSLLLDKRDASHDACAGAWCLLDALTALSDRRDQLVSLSTGLGALLDTCLLTVQTKDAGLGTLVGVV